MKNRNEYLNIPEFNSDLIENFFPPITLYDWQIVLLFLELYLL